MGRKGKLLEMTPSHTGVLSHRTNTVNRLIDYGYCYILDVFAFKEQIEPPVASTSSAHDSQRSHDITVNNRLSGNQINVNQFIISSNFNASGTDRVTDRHRQRETRQTPETVQIKINACSFRLHDKWFTDKWVTNCNNLPVSCLSYISTDNSASSLNFTMPSFYHLSIVNNVIKFLLKHTFMKTTSNYKWKSDANISETTNLIAD